MKFSAVIALSIAALASAQGTGTGAPPKIPAGIKWYVSPSSHIIRELTPLAALLHAWHHSKTPDARLMVLSSPQSTQIHPNNSRSHPQRRHGRRRNARQTPRQPRQTSRWSSPSSRRNGRNEYGPPTRLATKDFSRANRCCQVRA